MLYLLTLLCVVGVEGCNARADTSKLLMTYCCTMQFHRELSQKTSFRATDAMRCFAVSPPSQGTTFLLNCQFVLPKQGSHSS